MPSPIPIPAPATEMTPPVGPRMEVRPVMNNYNSSGYQNGNMSDANTPTQSVKGILDIQPEGHGFLRPKFTPSDKDIYISQSQIRKFQLRPGDMVGGQAREPKDNERYFGLLKVETINDKDAEKVGKRPDFINLTPIYPKEAIKLQTEKFPLSTRIIDLVAPIGKGQRGMIVSSPKAGKTTILKELAAGIAVNHPEIHLMAVLIGERPEEVTDISRSVKGEVVASNFDEPAENQTRVAEIALDRAKRLVEMGKDIFILLDSITRLARAYNLSIPTSGRTLSGGFDPAALYPPKRFFGAARCFEEGGSITIVGTALTETGSRMDDLIYEEFKGTGNMELHLDRSLAEKRIFPAINISRSGTRHEELLLNEDLLKKVVTMRRMLEMLSDEERTEVLVERLSKTKSNEEFLENLGKG
ncbi:transcription termination factor Rho [Candidatus Gottesmanbacteria bacterium]|nr:transcription termination factor Rho [Candidatus Gottesmanbacteria bacterium]